jgi:hypothetical protein
MYVRILIAVLFNYALTLNNPNHCQQSKHEFSVLFPTRQSVWNLL